MCGALGKGISYCLDRPVSFLPICALMCSTYLSRKLESIAAARAYSDRPFLQGSYE